jgi:WD40 repeat protein
MFGTHICGEAIAFSRDRKIMITGSWRDQDQLQFWDVGTGKVIRSYWVGDRRNNTPLKIYSLSISPDGDLVGMSGSESNQVVFYRVDDFSCVGYTEGFESCCSSVHLGERKFACGRTDSVVFVDSLPS